jgi:hypothetical protein
VPDHSPGSAVSVSPTCAVPITDGRCVFVAGAGATTAVAAESLLSDPPPFVPVTRTRRRLPTSSSVAT